MYPKFDHFSKKSFFAFSERSYCNLSFKKDSMKKRLILSKVINEKRFFPLIISIDCCQHIVTRSKCALKDHVTDAVLCNFHVFVFLF